MNTIGIDCRFAGTQSGLGRYTRCLVSQLLLRRDHLQYVLFVRSQQEQWLEHLKDAPTPYALRPAPALSGACPELCRRVEVPYTHYSFQERALLPLVVSRTGIDLLFSPHFNVPLLCPAPFVATIHDCILHRYPGDASLVKRMAYRVQMASTVYRSKALLAVSSFTALELGGMYGSSAHRKCIVTGEGVDENFAPASVASVAAIRTRYGLDRPFFFYVGSGKPHKNVDLLLAAFRALPRERDLVLVMPSGEVPGDLPQNVHALPEVREEDLPALYSSADCFVTASLYEGYGLPIAEALSCGCPVIANMLSAIPEVAQGQAMLIPPTREAWVEALRDPPKRPVRYRRPLWGEAAEKTARVLLAVTSH